MLLSAIRYPAQKMLGHPPLVMLHGLFGSAKNWGTVAKAMSATREVIALSLRNHGTSPHDSVMTYEAMARDVEETLAHLDLRSVDLLGHSMGGKAAMILALMRPAWLHRLIIVDIAPKPYPPYHSGFVKAMQAVPLEDITRRSQADIYLQKAIPAPELRGFILQNLIFSEGVARWQVNLEAIGNGMSNIEGFPDEVQGTREPFEQPTLFMAGQTSSYIRDADRDVIHTLFPEADLETIADAGHWPHAERPQVFIETLTKWLSTHPQ